MKVIQTFYSFSKDKDPINDSAGFLSPEFNWMSMALSCLLLKKHFGKVTLYCNNKVKELITNRLHIPYNEVVEIPEFMDRYQNCNLWALPKIYTYSKQNEPFIHVDCDWFMFDKVSDRFLSTPLCAQNIEYDDQYFYRNIIDKLSKNGVVLPKIILSEIDQEQILRATNAGIIGGNNIYFFKEYVELISCFIKQNSCVLINLKDYAINTIYEQLFFYVLSKRYNNQCAYCTEGDFLSTTLNWTNLDFLPIKKHGYMHLLANFKRHYNAYLFVSQYLRYINPELHKNIITCCKNSGVKPIINFFDITPEIFVNNISPNINENFKRTINFCLLHDIQVPNKIETYTTLENLLKNNVFKYSSKYTDIAKLLYDFEKTKYITNGFLSIHKYEIFQHQQFMHNSLWNITKQNFNVKITISKYVTYRKIVPNLIKHFLYIKDDISSKLKKENDIVIAIIPNTLLMKADEAILYGLNLSIFNIVKKCGEIGIHEILTKIIETKFVKLSDEQYKVVRGRIIKMIISAIEKNLYDVY